jgi:hypothetical protein
LIYLHSLADFTDKKRVCRFPTIAMIRRPAVVDGARLT